MATKGAIQKMQLEALESIASAMAQIAEIAGVEPVDVLTIRHRDPAWQELLRMQALEQWVSAVRTALVDSPVAGQGDSGMMQSLMNRMRKSDIEAFAAERQIAVAVGATKAEIIQQIMGTFASEEVSRL